MTLAPGTKLGPYEIVRQLGRGGMGVVYEGRDPRLERTVAIKLLPPDLTRDETAKRRFLQEAQAASALDHANICTIYEINETADGQSYLVMARYEGETLEARVARGPLTLHQAIDIATQVGQGLAEAHGAGIVHRDIKPANLFVTKTGVVKILDFGLAKLAGADGVTRTVTAVGTLAYMSPEQARGEEVDHRTDIWSLGVVFYEMLAGTRPFQGDNLLAVSESIRTAEPNPLSGEAAASGHVVRRALRKNAPDRYPTVRDLLAELSARPTSSTAIPETDRTSIAVLPFTNMSADPEQEYFSDGLTEEIIADMSQIRGLRVISRTSVMQLKQTKKNLQTIGRELNVRYVLEGSVRKAANNLRITAQLIDAPTDAHVWAEKYNGTLDDVFDIQERVSRAIVDALKLTLSPKEDRRIARRPIENVEAYDCYLKARREIELHTKDSFDRARDLLRTGLDIVGDNGALYAGLAYVYFNYVNLGHEQDAYIAKAEEHAHKALALDAESAEALLVLGLLDQAFRGNQHQALGRLERSAAITPDDPHTLFWLVVAYFSLGRVAAADAAVQRLQVVDPLTPISRVARPLADLAAGRYARALDFPWDAMPPLPVFVMFRALTLAWNRRLDDIRVVAASVPPEWDDAPTHITRIIGFAADGHVDAIHRQLNASTATTFRRDPLWAYFVAAMAGLAQDDDLALEWITIAVDRGFFNHPLLVRVDPLLQRLHDHPSYRRLLEGVEREWVAFNP